MSERLRFLTRLLRRVPASCWVVLLILPALVPLARPGFYQSADGLLHAFRLAALDRAVRAGVLYPRWFSDLAFGYGYPVLNFYSPLAYYWGLAFTVLGANPFVALKLVLATGLIASALGMFVFARLHLDRGPAVVAAAIYAYLPYHLADLYVRGAVAEYLAFVWFPLVLWGIGRACEQPSLRRVVLAALLSAALVVTHQLSILVFAPLFVGYVLFQLLGQPTRRSAGRALSAVAAAGTLALGLSAFYWLPVLAELRWVGLAGRPLAVNAAFLLPPATLVSLSPAYVYTKAPGAARVFPLSLIQAAVLAAALVLPFRLRTRCRPVLLFLACALLSAYMLTAASLPVWQALEPVLAYLLFPWRFSALLVMATAFLAGALVQGLTKDRYGRMALAGLLLLVTAGTALWRLPYRPTAPDASVEGMWLTEQSGGGLGTTWFDEYLPIWVDEQPQAISLPASQNLVSSLQIPAGQLRLTGVGYTSYTLTLDSPQQTQAVLHQFYYPGWQARWLGTIQLSHPEGILGLAAFDLPAGTGSLILRLGLTRAQTSATLLSVCTLLACAVALAARRRMSNSRPGALLWLLGLICLMAAAVLATSLVWPNGRVWPASPVQANLEDKVELLASRTDKTSYHAGETVSIILYLRALCSLDREYKAFVHLTDADLTRQPAQSDGDPGGGFTPVSRWLPGEILPDTHRLLLPTDLAPGRYLLWGGMYDFASVRNLQVVSAIVPESGNRVLLGEITVVAP